MAKETKALDEWRLLHSSNFIMEAGAKALVSFSAATPLKLTLSVSMCGTSHLYSSYTVSIYKLSCFTQWKAVLTFSRDVDMKVYPTVKILDFGTNCILGFLTKPARRLKSVSAAHLAIAPHECIPSSLKGSGCLIFVYSQLC